jgi:hypothetical protein
MSRHVAIAMKNTTSNTKVAKLTRVRGFFFMAFVAILFLHAVVAFALNRRSDPTLRDLTCPAGTHDAIPPHDHAGHEHHRRHETDYGPERFERPVRPAAEVQPDQRGCCLVPAT